LTNNSASVIHDNSVINDVIKTPPPAA